MPALEASLDRFRAANTQVLGVSVDSVHCHANWAESLGGVSFPLLADFHPKGAVAQSFGHYLDAAGITDRATVIVDREGKVCFSESVTPAGKREVDALVAEAERANAGQASALASASGLPDGTTLFVKSKCGPSRRTLLALDNLHARSKVALRNVTDDPAAAKTLEAAGGKGQAPCLVIGSEALYESEAIVSTLADRLSPIG